MNSFNEECGSKFSLSGDSVFFSLQGEGHTIGRPAVFLRLQVCNLRCSWCDTAYTWDMDKDEYWEWYEQEIEKTARVITDCWDSHCLNSELARRLIITGGEPLLQKGQIDRLLDLLPDWQVEIETNGTIVPSEKQKTRCSFNCSPKLAHSENSVEDRIVPAALEALKACDTVFKFVVREPTDLVEVEETFVKPFGISVERVVIMPEGRTAEEVSSKYADLAMAAMHHGYRLLPRLHLDIFQGKRRT